MRELKTAKYMAAVIMLALGLFWAPEKDMASDPELVSVREERMLKPGVSILEEKDEDTEALFKGRDIEQEIADKAAAEALAYMEELRKEQFAPAQVPEEVCPEDDTGGDSAPAEEEKSMIYLGAYSLTAYTSTGYPCANGNYPSEGYTVACNGLPFGTELYIEGYGYRTVEDRGGMPGCYDVDIFVGSYEEAIGIGRRTVNVYIVDQGR